ncbi:hypothetical protein FN846DRAFT_617663 [Sphaerosporella brunnea]|uniref:Alcohol acetyltransferase n=1 Tax=Sphaerosporella brunnea TaxID=1250544 RepID=A0A5J5F1M2_9PEZI|nr:hypothetical protein FN846DRAFT_617663 [Sphaerosporella brunnea]
MTPLRPLGALERWSAVRHDLGYHNSVSLLTTLSPSIILTRSTVFTALQHCISTHAVLSVTITPNGTSFSRLHLVDVAKTFTLTLGALEDSEVEGVLEEEASTGFSSGGVCWRMRVWMGGKEGKGEGGRVLFSWHHAVMDGEAGMLVVRTFMSAVLGPSPPHSPRQPELLPPIEDLLPLAVSWHTLLSKLPLPSWPTSAPTWTGPRITLSRFRTGIKLLKLGAAQMQTLRTRCRSEGTSITAFLHTVVAVAIMALEPNHAVGGSIAISLRRYLPLSAPLVGVMASSVDHIHSPFHSPQSATMPTASAIFSRARAVTTTITTSLSAGPADCKIALLRYTRDMTKYVEGREGKLRELGYGISNLGVVDVPGATEVVFCQSASPLGNAVDFCVVAGGQGECVLAAAYTLGAGMSRAWVEGVMAAVGEVVEEAVVF